MSERYLCLRCWRVVAREEAFYRCEACETRDQPTWMQTSSGARRRLGDAERPWYRRLFAEDAGPPGCPHHPAARIQLFCDCHYPLSERASFRHGAPLGLGIAGPRSSGKTLYLFTLLHELRRLDQASKRLGFVGIDDTEERFHALSAGFFDRGLKPDASREAERETQPWDERSGVGAANFAWRVTLASSNGRRPGPATLLAVYDLAGESWKLPPYELRASFDRYLEQLGSLVYLIDGASLAADLGYPVDDAWDASPAAGDRGAQALQWFSRVAERLGSRSRQVDLALVISKVDALWNEAPWSALQPGGEVLDEAAREELLATLLQRSHRRDLLHEARSGFRRVRLFAASSLGFQPAPEDVSPERHLTRQVAPDGIIEPVLWLLEQRIKGLQ